MSATEANGRSGDRIPPKGARTQGLWGWSAVLGLLAAACSPTGMADVDGPLASKPVEPVRALMTPAGVVAAVLDGGPGAWRVRAPCGGTATVANGSPITAPTAILDPGHGGDEIGAVGANGLAEKDVNLAVAEHAKRALEAQGTTVVLTRGGDYRMTIAARTDVVTALRPAAVVSVHHNGAPYGHSDDPGTEAYFQRASGTSRRLAGLVYEETVAYFSRHVGVTWHANVDPGAKYQIDADGNDSFGILRRSAGVPTVISEGLYLSSSPAEARLLARTEVQQGEGEAIARAIRRYLATADPGSGFVEPVPRAGPGGHSGGSAGCQDPPFE